MTETGPPAAVTADKGASEILRVRLRVRPAPGSSFVVEAGFEARPGITILFGPSGAGKSTLMAALAGLLPPDGGRVLMGETVWYDSDARIFVPPHRRRIGVVFQSLALFPHMTALQNVLFGLPRVGAERSETRAERRQRAQAFLERMRVGHLTDRRPVTYSGGEGQRVALARAFAVHPRLLLLDEAFSAMDESLRRELQADLRSYIDEARIPLIQITHHRDEARALGDRVVVLEAGQVRAVGKLALLG